MILGARQSQWGEASTEGVPVSTDPVLRTNLAAITCDPRPQLPDGYRRQQHPRRGGARRGPHRAQRLRATSRPGSQPLPLRRSRRGMAPGRLGYANPPASRRRRTARTMGSRLLPLGPRRSAPRRNNSESTARVAMFSSKASAAGAVVYPDTDMIWMWTDDDAVDIIVKRSSAIDDAAPWTTSRASSSIATRCFGWLPARSRSP